MKTVWPALAAVALLTAGCDLFIKKGKPVKSSGAVWAERVAQVQPGMAREEVERLLPMNPKAPLTRKVQDDSHIITYWLDDQWKVIAEYDFTGVPREKLGKSGFDSPQNKLLTAPRLERQYL